MRPILDSGPWNPVLNWESRPGRLLGSLADGLPAGRTWHVDVFGTAPLEMAYGGMFVSADADVTFPFETVPEMERILAGRGLTAGEASYYVQILPDGAFRTGPKWKDRAFVATLGSVHMRFAHPFDILLGKLNRLDEKDFRAFEVLSRLTGEPREETWLGELRNAPELFSITFYSLSLRSYRENVRLLWPRLYGREIDLEKEIFLPVIERLRRAYDLADDNKAALRAMAFDLGVQD